jgi:hypothetical protein
MPRIFTDLDDTILKDGQPVQRVIDYIDENGEEVVVLTNRAESEREKTLADLKAIGFEYDALIMNDSKAKAPAFKAGVIQAELDAGRPVDLFIDNRSDTRDAVAALGIKVMDPASIPETVEEDESEDDLIKEAPESKVSNLRKLKMTIEEQLLEASAALSGLTAERDDLRATVEKLTVGAAAELEQLKIEASVKDASIASLTEVVKTIEAEAAALKAAALEAESTKVSASKEAAQIAASVGVTPVALPQGDGAPAEAVNHYVAFMALPVGSKERNAYFEAHRSAIIKASF